MTGSRAVEETGLHGTRRKFFRVRKAASHSLVRFSSSVAGETTAPPKLSSRLRSAAQSFWRAETITCAFEECSPHLQFICPSTLSASLSPQLVFARSSAASHKRASAWPNAVRGKDTLDFTYGEVSDVHDRPHARPSSLDENKSRSSSTRSHLKRWIPARSPFDERSHVRQPLHASERRKFQNGLLRVRRHLTALRLLRREVCRERGRKHARGERCHDQSERERAAGHASAHWGHGARAAAAAAAGRAPWRRSACRRALTRCSCCTP